MDKQNIIQHYVGYIEILIDEGEVITLDEALDYIKDMFRSDTSSKDLKANRFIGLDYLLEESKKRLIEIGLN